ncbi:VOC family protein [Salicibibacter halophilus]|uniref:VOC family protein n=1 Tax=Salicibibacter halophilus TaxID=2502791 RepID=A0A514LHN0_9BACI|nr:VOC family protein [Salicibibacter halophilus]QDI91347.1 VOC family protein [Salicibibacter halophilus]
MGYHSKPNTFVEHVTVKVKDLERSLHFYQEVIGFNILEQTKTTAELTADGKTSLLTVEELDNPAPKQGRATGLYHYALLLPRRSDLADIVHHFVEKGIQIGSSDHLVSESLYLADPDGNGIEIYADRHPSKWKWNNGQVAMAVDPLNFQDLLAEKKKGETWKGLPAGTIMGHIHLHVSDLQETKEFYTKGLDFEVVSQLGGQALFISTGDYHHHLGLNTWMGAGAPAPEANSTGLKFFTLRLPDADARERVIADVEKTGAEVSEENGTFVTSDPSGNRIHLVI